MELGYYPGCALHGTSNDYEDSVRACLDALGVGLKEVNDWICCGATAAHSINHKLSIALPARNLALAEREGFGEILAPCPMCSMELLKASDLVKSDAALRQEMGRIVELDFEGRTSVLNLIQVFQKVGLDTIKAAVKSPLEGLKAACYYGCLLTRPPETLRFDDCESVNARVKIGDSAPANGVPYVRVQRRICFERRQRLFRQVDDCPSGNAGRRFSQDRVRVGSAR